MSEDILLRLIAQDQYSKEMASARAAIDKMSDAEKKAAIATKEHSDQMDKLGKIAKGAALAGITAVTAAITDSIKETMDYNKSIRDLAQNLNITTEETSRIVQTADDFTVSQEAVTSALQMAVKKGMQPNIETLATMADKYNSISDPTKRAAELTEVFGRNWTALTPMLKEGGQAIREAAAAQDDALIVTEEQSKKTRELEKGLDALNDKILAVKLSIGNALIPILTQASDAFTILTEGQQKIQDAFDFTEKKIQTGTQEYSDYKAATEATARAAGLLTTEFVVGRGYVDKYADGFHILTQEQWNAVKAAQGETQETRYLYKATTEYNSELYKEAGAMAAANDGLRAYAEATQVGGKASQDFAKWIQEGVNAKLADLKVTMAGAVSNEMTQYGAKQDDLAAKASKLRGEIQKLQASQGAAIVTTQKNKMTDDEMAAAKAKLAMVTEDLTNKTKRKNETDKEFASRMAGLTVQADNLRGKIDGTAKAVQGYVDNSKKIGELKTEYDAVNAEIEANAKAHEDATKRILFGMLEQRAAIGGLTSDELNMLTLVAEKWGLVDKGTADVMKTFDGLVSDFDAGKKSIYDVANASDTLASSLLKIPTDIQVRVSLTQTGDIPNVGHPSGTGTQPATGAPATRPTRPTRQGPPAAVGADYIVPPGYRENWMQPASSGERVTVTPQSNYKTDVGGITINVNGAGDPNAVAQRVSQILARQLRAYGAQ